MNPLPFYLNALFSAACGLAMLAAPQPLAEAIGLPWPLALSVIGVGLLVFALQLVWVGRRGRRDWALVSTLEDFAWVAATPVVLVWLWPEFTALGVAALVLVAVLVDVLGTWQWLALRRTRA